MAVSIKELYNAPAFYEGKTITVRGWVRNLRDAKQIGFVELNDGSSLLGLQIVLEREKLSNYPEAARQNVGAALIVTGRLNLTPGLKQPFELKAETVLIEGESAPEYPLQKKRHSMEFLREKAHLRPRTNTFSAVFRVRSALAFAVHQFFQERGFLYVHTPIITTSDAEGAGEMFKVTTLDLQNPPKDEGGRVNFQEDFFKKPAGLTVSGQLEGESFALAFQKIYTFGPTFRAENSNTARHAAEFWMIEPELAFADLQDDMTLAQDMVKFVIGWYLEKCPQEVEFFTQFFDPGLKERLCGLISSDFGHMTYTEAIAVLEKHKDKFEYPVFWGCDLQTEHERFLTEEVMKKPLFVTDYPKEIKAFYMRQNDDHKTVAAMDLLVPGIGEIIGGSQREERAEVLEKRIRELKLNPGDYGWYLELRKYGGARHCGFGLGFERLIMYLTGVPNIRDVIPFPRTAGSAEF